MLDDDERPPPNDDDDGSEDVSVVVVTLVSWLVVGVDVAFIDAICFFAAASHAVPVTACAAPARPALPLAILPLLAAVFAAANARIPNDDDGSDDDDDDDDDDEEDDDVVCDVGPPLVWDGAGGCVAVDADCSVVTLASTSLWDNGTGTCISIIFFLAPGALLTGWARVPLPNRIFIYWNIFAAISTPSAISNPANPVLTS
jgi:hypothetical protein